MVSNGINANTGVYINTATADQSGPRIGVMQETHIQKQQEDLTMAICLSYFFPYFHSPAKYFIKIGAFDSWSCQNCTAAERTIISLDFVTFLQPANIAVQISSLVR